MKQVLNVKEVAEKLGIPLRTLHEWLKTDRCPISSIPGTKPPKWKLSDVNEFIG